MEVFKLESIVDKRTSRKNKITSQKVSEKKFWVDFENSFVVLDDSKTIIGVDAKSRTILMEENLWDGKYSKVIGQHGKRINTILHLAGLNALLVGDDNNQLVQYQQGLREGWVVSRDYKDLGIGKVLSSTCIGNLAVLGGNNGCVRVVDVEQAEMLGEPYRTAI